MSGYSEGRVSLILINYRGLDDTLEALSYVDKLDWPKSQLEVIVVDNNSGDGSAEAIKKHAPPYVKLVSSKVNTGFAGGCNLGVSHSSGEFIGFLNNDARPDSEWVKAAVRTFATSSRIGAVASKVLSWDGTLVDYIGSAMTWFGMGYKPFTAERVPRFAPNAGDVLFGTGAAMFVRRTVFDELSGFDERYFMFFEDVDFGWRLNLKGYAFRYDSESLVYHKHHASMGGYGSFKESYLLERNALFTLYKNLGDERLNETLAAAISLAVRRGVARSQLDSHSFDLRNGTDESESMRVDKQVLSVVFGIDQFVSELPGLASDRASIQGGRSVSERTIWKLFGLADVPVFQDENYVRGYENVVSAFDVSQPPLGTKVLIITGDPIGSRLAGPAIRAWHMALTLAQENQVRLISLSGVSRVSEAFDLAHVSPGDERSFSKHEAWADVIIFQGHAMAVFDVLRRSNKILVVDIYDPMHLEQLEQGRSLPPSEWARQVSDANTVLNEQMERGDFFLCASERQRMFWLGQLASLGRINTSTYIGDPDLKGLISVVPFGLPSTAPQHNRRALKGVVQGIVDDDKVVLWSGGLYNWFDPATLVKAVAELSQSRPNIRLFFLGTKHPHPGVPEMEIVGSTRNLARELGVLNENVFLNDSWVEYSDRQNYLLEADVGVSTHFSHIETTFSFRTRILDYLWASLPIVTTEGDHFADLVKRERLGIVVRAGDVTALAEALDRALFDEVFIAECKLNIERVRTEYFWENALSPLVDFVSNPVPAADRRQSSHLTNASTPSRRVRRTGLRHDLSMVVYHLRSGGPRVVWEKTIRRLRAR